MMKVMRIRIQKIKIKIMWNRSMMRIQRLMPKHPKREEEWHSMVLKTELIKNNN
jgi:hypothetical protein